LKSPSDMMKTTGVGALLVVLAACVIPLFIKEEYYLHFLIMGGVSAIMCMGWTLLLRLGLFSLGHAAFLGIGAYVSAILTMRAGVAFWLSLPLSGGFTALLAFCLGMIILRLKGIYFAVVTFAFGEVVRIVYLNWNSLLGGYSGLSGIPRPEPLLGLAFDSKMPNYYLILLLTVITAVVFYRIDRSRAGRIFRAIGNNSDLAQSQGVNIRKYKVISFTLSCFFIGIAGSFLAHYYTALYPDEFGIWESIIVQIKATVGGVATVVSGPIIGAVVMTVVSEVFRGYMSALEPLFFGIFIILVVFFLPGGLQSLPGMVFRRAEKDQRKE
jgi:branched-chain amino acid transport system permease protein